jgi:transposase InsO family protein
MNIHSRARLTPVRRVELAELVERSAWAVSRASKALGVSPRTGRKWLERYRTEGRAGLLDRSSRPKHSPGATCPEAVAVFLSLRKQRFTVAAIARRTSRARSTVAAVLRRHGLSRLPPLLPPPPVVRYEYSAPGDLLHIDTKKLGRIERVGHRITGDKRGQIKGAGWEHVHVCVDDATRAAYMEVLASDRKEDTSAFLERARRWYQSRGVTIRRVMTDNGPGYKSRLFAQACAGAKHIRTKPYTPRTNGKAERLVQTMLREWAYARPYASSADRTAALRGWLNHYNRRRPHSSLGGRTPLSRLSAAVDNVPGLHS